MDEAGFPCMLIVDDSAAGGRRLMALAGVYDALISHRIYKPAFVSIEHAFPAIATRFADAGQGTRAIVRM